MRVKKKVVSPSSILASSLLLIVSGILLIVRTEKAISLISILLPAYLIFLGLGAVLTYLFNRKKELRITLVKGIIYLVLAALVVYKPVFTVAALVRAIGVYALINAGLRLVSAYIMKRDEDRVWVHYLIDGSVSLLFALIFIINPVKYVETLTIFAGVYIILYGGTLFIDFYREISLLEPDGIHFRRHLRMPMPVWIAAFMPIKLLNSINKTVQVQTPQTLLRSEELKEEGKGRLMIFLHLAPDIAMGFGHVDISLDGVTYSYGTYDDSSVRVYGMISDGVLMETPTEGYIRYCNEFRKRSLIGYTLDISDAQAEAIHAEINKLKERCVRWYCPAEKDEKGDYSKEISDTNLLYQKNGATFYKFKKGAFKTYFAVTANCVKLVDRILGAGGFDLLGINGLITPGTYYSYLERQLTLNETIVTGKTLFESNKIEK